MASELRVNKLTNRSGLGTVTYTDTGAIVSGITTASNFKTGTTNVHSTGVELANINTGGSTATFGGDLSIPDTIVHTGDTNTKIRFPGNDTFQVETDGSARLKITDGDLTMLDYPSGDKVGIGTNVLVAKLDVKNNSNIPVIKLQDSHYNKYLTIRGGGSPNRMVIDSYEGGGGGADIDFASNGSTKVRIKSTGRVGIGTEDPQGTLDITGNRQGTSIDMDGAFKQDGSMNWNFAQHQWIRSASNTNATKIVSILAAGDNAADTNLYNNINFVARTSSNFGAASTSRGIGVSLEITSPNDIRFGTNTEERLRIDSTGRLLIGTTIEGNESADELTVASSGNTGITIRSGTSSNASIFFTDATSGADEYRGFVQYIQSSDDLKFGTATSERLRITNVGDVQLSTGNLILGTNDKGISFANSSSSPDSNSTSSTRIMTDYDEGTCDWELHRSDGLTTGSNNGATNVTYTKIGNRVFMSGYVYTASTGSSTGVTARLTNASGGNAELPYTPNHHGGMPIIHTRTIDEKDRMSVSFVGGSKIVYVHTDQGNNQYTPDQNDVNISSAQTHLVLAFTGSYRTSD